MKQLLNKEGLKQFISYVFVGGIAALVEWAGFYLFSNILNINYIVSTVLAFVFSTGVNLILGKLWTFKGNDTYNKKRAKEVVLIYGVSAIGLLFNMLLMYLFVSVIGLNTPILKVVSKVISTGIVFFWNFLIRKFVIYKNVNKDGTD